MDNEWIVLICLAVIGIIIQISELIYLIRYFKGSEVRILKKIDLAHKQNYLFFKQINPEVDIKKNKPTWVNPLGEVKPTIKGEAYSPNRDHMTHMDGSRSELFEGDDDDDMFD